MKVTLKIDGREYACTLNEEGEIAVEPQGEGITLDDEVFAGEVQADYAYYKSQNPDLPHGFIDAYEEMADWMRINYGEKTVTVEQDEEEPNTEY